MTSASASSGDAAAIAAHHAAEHGDSPEGALAGIRVLDLSRILAGPWCGMLLGDLGADVIKVELPGNGDDTRGWGPPFLADESVYFLGCNRSKRGMAIDLAHAEGKALLARLLARADVLVENFKPGTLDRWGFGDAWRAEHAPHLVHCSITGYGASGPKAALPGYDFILQAESGLMSICGPVDGTPSKYGVAIVDLATGMMAANAIQAALIARFRTGRGQRVGASLYESAIALLANVGNSHLATGKPARRFGNGHPTIVPYTTYPSSDGVVAVAVGNDQQFARLATLLGHAEWAIDERFRTNAARVEHRDAVDDNVADAFAERTTAELLAALQQHAIPAGPVRSVGDALADPHTLARGLVVEAEHPLFGVFKSLASPLTLNGTPTVTRRAPPTLGQHTREILSTDLGLSAAQIAALYDARVVA